MLWHGRRQAKKTVRTPPDTPQQSQASSEETWDKNPTENGNGISDNSNLLLKKPETQFPLRQTTTKTNPQRVAFPGLPTADALRLLLGPEAPVVLPFIESLAPLLAGYPASWGHHRGAGTSSEADGLLAHSFTVAEACATIVSRLAPEDSGVRLVAYLAGLTHDLGRIAYLRTDGRFTHEPLLGELLPPGVEVTGKIPERDGWGQHHVASAYMVSRLMPDDLVRVLGLERTMMLIEAVVGSHGGLKDRPGNPVLLALQQADQHTVGEELAADVELQDVCRLVLRQRLLEWKENWSWYVFKRAAILAILNPRAWKEVVHGVSQRVGRPVAESSLFHCLRAAGWLYELTPGRAFGSWDVTVPGKPAAHLSLVTLHAGVLLSPEAIERCAGARATAKVAATKSPTPVTVES